MGIKGSLVNRKLGLNGKPTQPELIMEAALKKYLINFIPQQIFEIGIMDFFIPGEKIAVFCDGVYYHADPRKYNATHKVYGKTAKQIWKKDLRHNSFLESQGYKVLRFWENEIIENVDKCIRVIKDNLSLQNHTLLANRNIMS